MSVDMQLDLLLSGGKTKEWHPLEVRRRRVSSCWQLKPGLGWGLLYHHTTPSHLLSKYVVSLAPSPPQGAEGLRS